ncbi:MAG: type II secretion system protein GspC [Pseudomonadota bacterium]
MLANIAIILLLAHTFARLTWQLAGVSTPSSSYTAVFPTFEVEKRADSPSLSELAAMHLLGEVNADIEPVNSEPVEAPETRLNLELKGLFAVNRPEAAMAIIAADGRDERSYHVGDNVAGAATVHQILPDRVILKRGERFEALMLPKDLLKDLDRGGARTKTPASRKPEGQVRRLPGLRQRIQDNPQEALNLIKASPVMDNGTVKGYRVMPGIERQMFASAGLRPNDVVTQVNGIPLSDPKQIGQVMQQLSSTRRVEVTVERNGQPVTLSVDLE